MKIINKLYAIALGVLLMTGCQAGLEYTDVPESIYSNVNLASNLCNVRARQLFENQIYANNWNQWVPNYIGTVTIGNYQGDGKEWTNNSNSAFTINGVSVNPGGKTKVKNSLTEESLAEAPGGKLYVVNLFADAFAQYPAPNKGYVYDGSKFTGSFELVNPTNGRADNIKLPVRQNEVIVELLLSQEYNCKVYPQNGAPELGKPGDFTQPRRYLVVNESRRTDGQEAAKRLYEVRITFLPYTFK